MDNSAFIRPSTNLASSIVGFANIEDAPNRFVIYSANTLYSVILNLYLLKYLLIFFLFPFNIRPKEDYYN